MNKRFAKVIISPRRNHPTNESTSPNVEMECRECVN